MPDRVKQAIFDMLAVRYETPGGLPPLPAADLFAGSGSMGLEALSRGASRCWFYERDRDALEALRRNIDAVDAARSATVVAADAWRAGPRTAEGAEFELVFLDPPYRDTQDLTAGGPVRRFLGRWSDSPRQAQAQAQLERATRLLVVFHHPATAALELPADDPWTVVDRRTFGTNGVTFLSR